MRWLSLVWLAGACCACRFEEPSANGVVDAPVGTADATPADAHRPDAAPVDAPPPQPVAFDHSSAPMGSCNSADCYVPIAVGSGGNALITAWYFCVDSNDASGGLTIDGDRATLAGSAVFDGQIGELWYAPATPGTHMISTDGGDCNRWLLGALSAVHVDQTAPIRAVSASGSDGFETLMETSIQSAPGDLVVDAACHGTAIASATGQTKQFITNLSGNLDCDNIAAGTQPGAPVVNPQWTANNPNPWAMLAASLQPAP